MRTQAAEILENISAAGGSIWLDGDLVRMRLPESLRPLVDVLRQHKAEIIEILSQRPQMPGGVRLLSWNPKAAPVQLSLCETVVGVEKFIEATLAQVDARLHDKNWLAGNWPLSELLARLEAVGCVVELADRKAMLQ